MIVCSGCCCLQIELPTSPHPVEPVAPQALAEVLEPFHRTGGEAGVVVRSVSEADLGGLGQSNQPIHQLQIFHPGELSGIVANQNQILRQCLPSNQHIIRPDRSTMTLQFCTNLTGGPRIVQS